MEGGKKPHGLPFASCYVTYESHDLLPHVSVGWGKVIVSVCLFVHRGSTPSQVRSRFGGGVPHGQFLMGGYPWPTPNDGTPSRFLMGGIPNQGTPHPGMGIPPG